MIYMHLYVLYPFQYSTGKSNCISTLISLLKNYPILVRIIKVLLIFKGRTVADILASLLPLTTHMEYIIQQKSYELSEHYI